jgi:hypothetical protein
MVGLQGVDAARFSRMSSISEFATALRGHSGNVPSTFSDVPA